MGGALFESMTRSNDHENNLPRRAAVFGSSGAIGGAIVDVLVESGCELVHAGSRRGDGLVGAQVRPFAFDLESEDSIAQAASAMQDDPPEWVIVATGVLTLDNGQGPERSFKKIDAASMNKVFALNTFGPALIAKHVLPIMPRDRRTVFAALSARVGSIGDNRLGGWHSYRASKAALNMLLRNFAIELARTNPNAIVAGLHPGTVDSALSRPFQANLAEGQLTGPGKAARDLVRVLGTLTPEHSGQVFDYAGQRIPE